MVDRIGAGSEEVRELAAALQRTLLPNMTGGESASSGGLFCESGKSLSAAGRELACNRSAWLGDRREETCETAGSRTGVFPWLGVEALATAGCFSSRDAVMDRNGREIQFVNELELSDKALSDDFGSSIGSDLELIGALKDGLCVGWTPEEAATDRLGVGETCCKASFSRSASPAFFPPATEDCAVG